MKMVDYYRNKNRYKSRHFTEPCTSNDGNTSYPTNYINPLYSSPQNVIRHGQTREKNYGDECNIISYPSNLSSFGKTKTGRYIEGPEPIRGISNIPTKQLVNAEIRRNIIPKSPVVVLSELSGYVAYDVIENPPENVNNSPHFIACCEIHGEIFSGNGPTKFIAKNMCAENAIRGIIIKRHALVNIHKDTGFQDKLSIKDYVGEEEDAWKGLACVGLFKMFNDWSAEGYEAPEWFYKCPSNEPSDVNKIAAKPKNLMPKNPTQHHPVSLLTMLCGKINYKDIRETGDGVSKMFIGSIEVDLHRYMGNGRTKKEAKKNCAVNALKEKYGIIYPNSANTFI